MVLLTALAIGLASCGDAEVAETERDSAQQEPRVLAPLTGTLDRARGVQQTVDSGAAELRKRLEEAER
jgi:hypothetical protein